MRDPQATAPHSDTEQVGQHQKLACALVVISSIEDPGAVGEIVFLRPDEECELGRDVGTLSFGKQRPGGRLVPGDRPGSLTGRELSRRQLRLRLTGAGIKMKVIGKTQTFVNGERVEEATLQPRDRVMLQGVGGLICVMRPLTVPDLEHFRATHRFGERNSLGMVGESPVFLALCDRLAKLAMEPYDILVNGESGSGKEAVARTIHALSARASGPFVSRSAATLPEGVTDADLFGVAAKFLAGTSPGTEGLFPAANNGTLFLDEIGEIHPKAQAKLLRVLDAGEFTPVGAARPQKVNLRTVAATNQDDSVFRKEFRARFTRTLTLPPVRERPEDIALLLRHLFLEAMEANPSLSRYVTTTRDGDLYPRFHPALVDFLVGHPLPLNVRQLRAMLLEAIDGSAGETRVMLPPNFATSASAMWGMTAPGVMAEPESALAPSSGGGARSASGPASGGGPASAPPSSAAKSRPKKTKGEIEAVLAASGASVRGAALALGVPRSTLQRWMKEYGMGDDEG